MILASSQKMCIYIFIDLCIYVYTLVLSVSEEPRRHSSARSQQPGGSARDENYMSQ